MSETAGMAADADIDVAVNTDADTGASEDVCVIPATMRRYVVPRRRREAIEARAISSAAAKRYETLLREPSKRRETILADPNSDPTLVEAFRVSGHDLATATPLGVATGAAMLLFQHLQSKLKDLTDIVDSWVAARGIVFATTATLELFAIDASELNGGAGGTTSVHLHKTTQSWQTWKTGDMRFEIAVRLRRHLASASDADYAASSDVITEYRIGTPVRAAAVDWQRLLTSFLMPERTAKANGVKSKVRARVEHLFAQQKDKMGLFIRTIGIERAEAKITLANLAFNLNRLIFHERRAAMG